MHWLLYRLISADEWPISDVDGAQFRRKGTAGAVRALAVAARAAAIVIKGLFCPMPVATALSVAVHILAVI